MRPFASQSGGDFGCLATEPQQWTLPRPAHYFHILPGHSVAQTGADRFHASLFSGKSGGQTLSRIRLGQTVSGLLRSKDPLQKTVSKAIHSSLDPGHLSDVNSCAYNHLGEVLSYHKSASNNPKIKLI